MVVIEAEHMCMTMRGVKKPGTKTLTTTMRGSFLENYELVHGTNIFGENAYSDVGIIGLLGRFGILGLFLYVGLFIKEVKILKNTRNSLAMAILIITVLSCVNLSLFDAERLPVLAIYMAVLDGIVSNNVIKETL